MENKILNNYQTQKLLWPLTGESLEKQYLHIVLDIDEPFANYKVKELEKTDSMTLEHQNYYFSEDDSKLSTAVAPSTQGDLTVEPVNHFIKENESENILENYEDLDSTQETMNKELEEHLEVEADDLQEEPTAQNMLLHEGNLDFNEGKLQDLEVQNSEIKVDLEANSAVDENNQAIAVFDHEIPVEEMAEEALDSVDSNRQNIQDMNYGNNSTKETLIEGDSFEELESDEGTGEDIAVFEHILEQADTEVQELDSTEEEMNEELAELEEHLEKGPSESEEERTVKEVLFQEENQDSNQNLSHSLEEIEEKDAIHLYENSEESQNTEQSPDVPPLGLQDTEREQKNQDLLSDREEIHKNDSNLEKNVVQPQNQEAPTEQPTEELMISSEHVPFIDSLSATKIETPVDLALHEKSEDETLSNRENSTVNEDKVEHLLEKTELESSLELDESLIHKNLLDKSTENSPLDHITSSESTEITHLEGDSLEKKLEEDLGRVAELQEQEVHVEFLLTQKRQELEDLLTEVDLLIGQLPKEKAVDFEKKKYQSLYGHVYDKLGL